MPLKTPVLFFNTATFGPERLNGLGELLLQSNLEDYKENYEIFDVENPPQNSNNYLRIRDNLINETKKFTGYFSEFYGSNYSPEYTLVKQMEILSKTTVETKKYTQKVAQIVDDYELKMSERRK